MQSPMFKAAWQYRFLARRARQAGATPLTDDVARAAAAGLLKTAAQWHQEWLNWRIELGRPPQVPSEPLPPPETPRGAVIRAAKSLGHAHQTGSPDKAAQATPAAAPEPALDESLERADRPEPVEG